MVDEQRLQMGVAIILSSLVVFVILAERRESFQPPIDVFDQAGLIVIHINARGYVHGRDQHNAFFDATFLYDGFHLRRDMDVIPVVLSVKL